jgi:hypothetical protein
MACEASESLELEAILDGWHRQADDMDVCLGYIPKTNLQASNQAPYEATSLVQNEASPIKESTYYSELNGMGARNHALDSSTHQTSTFPVRRSQATEQSNSDPNNQLSRALHGSNPSEEAFRKASSLKVETSRGSSDTASISSAEKELNPSSSLYQSLVHSATNLYSKSSKRRRISQENDVQTSSESSDTSIASQLQSREGINDNLRIDDRIQLTETSIGNVLMEGGSWDIWLEAISCYLKSDTDSHISVHQSKTYFPVKNNDLNVSEVLRFDEKAFSQNEYISPEVESRAKLFIEFIKKYKNKSPQLFISKKNPSELWSFLITNTAGQKKGRPAKEEKQCMASTQKRKLDKNSSS